ncbi:ribosome recycling factor [Patescibacteria group bacterium]|nr:ribosome recycling factor [Patescibacteria group bacterium]
MTYDFKHFDTKLTEAKEWLVREFAAVRTGRATPALLDMVHVESYGTRVPLVQVGSVGNEDARTLRITLWDKGQIKAVEKAITDANLGVSVMSDDKGIRVIFPELTSDRRVQLMKLAKAKLEESRVAVRKARDEVMKDIEAKEKEGEMSEDDKFRVKEDVQKRVDLANRGFDEMLTKKEAEIQL